MKSESTFEPAIVQPGSGAGNIIRVWNLADATDRLAGRRSYQGYRTVLTRLARERGHQPHVAWGVFAALSPLSTEYMGYANTAAMLAGRKPKTGFSRDIGVAKQILAGADPDNVLLGPKTRAFYHCIADPLTPDHVVIDGHMHALWLGRLVQLRAVRSLPKDRYSLIAADFRLVADVMGLPVSTLQATCWYTWRRLRGLPLAGVYYHNQLGLWDTDSGPGPDQTPQVANL